MKLKIAENIRKFRHDLNLSQEQLAERLGVRFQAVSKWERGETYPDIELLPSIASFFSISVDELIGTNEIEESKTVDKIVESLRLYDIQKNYPLLVKTAEDGLAQFPNNHLLMGWIVYGSSRINPKRSIELGEYVLSNCRKHHILNWVRTELCYAYFNNGEKEKAVMMAQTLPLSEQSRREVLRNLLEDDKQVKYILSNIVSKYCHDFWYSIQKLLPHYSFQEQLLMTEKCISLIDIIFESDDDLSSLKLKSDIYCKTAKFCAENNEPDKAICYLRFAIDCACKHDMYPYGTHSASVLRGCKKYDYKVIPSGPSAHPYQKLKEIIIEAIKSDEDFAMLKSVKGFQELLSS